ncbi:Glycogenin [Aspergillus sclerotialis]|uniref:Glycogenin n=1 Tax=Aspergillus sclerotialis TaxID=2070753 RepID=A0A3A2ZB77_9EURO|nr:Glycogenin [Aspergillus sclerotialis]
MSDDPHLFQPPSEYPEAPKDMYYQVPETKPEPKKLTRVFPWEDRAPKPTRVFLDDGQSLISAHGKYSSPPIKDEPGPSTGSQIVQPPEEPTDTWENYSRSNAWDEVPEIQRYIQTIQQARKAKTQVISGTTTTTTGQKAEFTEPETTQESTKLTDFPSEVERPSLPVTPAPIRRLSVWNRRSDEISSELPAAEGVPNQEDWVGLTVDVFLHLLRASYLYWKFTESCRWSRRPAASSVRSLG